MTDATDHLTIPADPGARAAAFVRFMAESGVITFGDLVGKSGRRMPYFIDAGRYRTGHQAATLGRFYAAAIEDAFGDDVDVLFGPAYKGIPIAVSTAIALAEHHGREVAFCFDRKEAKDHGEGGRLIGHRPVDGDRVVIVEDVTTAGTSVRATIPLLRGLADVEVVGLVVGVDRREHGTQREVSAVDELAECFDLTAVSLATIDDVVSSLDGVRIGGELVLSDEDRARIAAYRAEHGVS